MLQPIHPGLSAVALCYTRKTNDYKNKRKIHSGYGEGN